MLTTSQRRPVFKERAEAERVVSILEQVTARQNFALYAFCVMPDHCHLLIQGKSADADLKALVSRFKQQSSFHHKKISGAALWQQSFFDRVLRQDEDLQAIADYIFHNPVAAGFVETARAYDLSGGLYWDVTLVEDGAKASSLRSEFMTPDGLKAYPQGYGRTGHD